MTNLQEIWQPVKGFEGLYEVSNFGKVKSLSKIRHNSSAIIKERILRLGTQRQGYKFAYLYKESTKYTFLVHRLVAIAFIENKRNYPEVNHKNLIKSDNSVSNLEWVDPSQNVRHAYKNNAYPIRRGADHHSTKITLNKQTGVYYGCYQDAYNSTNKKIGFAHFVNKIRQGKGDFVKA